MHLYDLPLSVYRQLAACLEQCSHGDGDDPGEPWWVVMAVHPDITRREQMDIGKFKLSLLSHFNLKSTNCFKQMNKQKVTISVRGKIKNKRFLLCLQPTKAATPFCQF